MCLRRDSLTGNQRNRHNSSLREGLRTPCSSPHVTLTDVPGNFNHEVYFLSILLPTPAHDNVS